MFQLSVTTESNRLGRRTGLLTLCGLTYFLVVASVGCRSTADNQIDLLERELRTQEDYIYELESYVVEYSEKLRDSRCAYPQQTAGYAEEVLTPEPAQQRSQQSAPRDGDEADELRLEADENIRPTPNKTQQTPEITPSEPTPTEISPEDMEVPDEIEFDIGEPVSEWDQGSPLRQVAAVGLAAESRDDGTLIIPDPVDFVDMAADDKSVGSLSSSAETTNEAVSMAEVPLAEELFDDDPIEETVALADRVADHLEVTQLFQNEEAKQASLLTVVEALDANGEPVDLDGEVSLMVMTASAETPQRLKRWNFTADETVAAWQSSELGDGLHLELPLDKMRLPAAPLELWVRLVMDDGRKLLTQLPFRADQLSGIATGETPADVASVSAAKLQTPSKTNRATQNQPLTLVEQEMPSDQPRWRASMQHSGRFASGHAATSRKKQGWTTQAISRERRAAVEVASRGLASAPHHRDAALPTQSSWNSARTVVPAAPQTRQQPGDNRPATWSSSR